MISRAALTGMHGVYTNDLMSNVERAFKACQAMRGPPHGNAL